MAGAEYSKQAVAQRVMAMQGMQSRSCTRCNRGVQILRKGCRMNLWVCRTCGNREFEPKKSCK